VVEVNNLRLYDDFKDFSEFQNQIEQCKINFLLRISKLYKDVKLVFYNVIGEFALIEEVEKLLGSIFKNYEIIYEPTELDFNSSPINNVPIIRVNGETVTLEDVETIGLKRINDVRELTCEYTKCFYVLEVLTNQDLDENIRAFTTEIDPKNFIESELVSRIDNVGEKYLVLKLIRGEEPCF